MAPARTKKYVRDNKVGEGTYAIIYKGYECFVEEGAETEEMFVERQPQSQIGREVAIKKIKLTKHGSGIEMSALREIKCLKRIQSEYVVKVFEVFEQGGNIHIVLEYMESNLEVLIKSKRIVFVSPDVKAWMLMIAKGIYECHSRFILHRDIKPNNILVSRSGRVKLADFGLARDFGFPVTELTNKVITRWYKSPEILFGSKTYTYGVDIWAAGCVFAELLLRTPYFPGDNDVHQMELIFTALGSPTQEEWPEMQDLPAFLPFEPRPKSDIRLLFTGASDDTVDLLKKMLTHNPAHRITAKEVLSHPYFTNNPRPSPPEALPFDC